MKQIYSKNHSIAAAVAACLVAPLGANGKPLADTLLVQHPPGTVLKFEDDAEADDLIARGIGVEYDPKVAKADKNGIVAVTRAQAVAPPLPEGFSQPVVVRQDETLNDGTPTTNGVAAPVVLRDTKNDAEVAEAQKKAVDASEKAAKDEADAKAAAEAAAKGGK